MKEIKKNIFQFLKFGLIGISNTVISELVYIILVCLRFNYLFASCMGFGLSVLNAFYWNNRFVFKEKTDEEHRVWWKTLIKTYIAYLGGFILNLLLLIFFIDILQIAKYLGTVVMFLNRNKIFFFDADLLGNLFAEGICLVITIPINFIVNKYWAFRQKKLDVHTSNGNKI